MAALNALKKKLRFACHFGHACHRLYISELPFGVIKREHNSKKLLAEVRKYTSVFANELARNVPHGESCQAPRTEQHSNSKTSICIVVHSSLHILYVSLCMYVCTECVLLCFAKQFNLLYRGADKSLVRSGRKQATATKL